jgi:hypothetical protein
MPSYRYKKVCFDGGEGLGGGGRDGRENVEVFED